MAKFKSIAIVSVLLFLAGLVAAQAIGSFTQVAGKVEFQKPGGSWTTARSGDQIVKGTVISVGFKSSAVVKTRDASITVKALTRLAIEDIVETEGGTKTALFLSSGRVKTEVTPPAGLKSEFKVKSPTATASVRGTGFDFDGMNIVVDHGGVDLTGNTGRTRRVPAGMAAFVTSSGDVPPPVPSSGGLGAIAAAGSQSERDAGGQDAGPPERRHEERPPVIVEPDPIGTISITVPLN